MSSFYYYIIYSIIIYDNYDNFPQLTRENGRTDLGSIP